MINFRKKAYPSCFLIDRSCFWWSSWRWNRCALLDRSFLGNRKFSQNHIYPRDSRNSLSRKSNLENQQAIIRKIMENAVRKTVVQAFGNLRNNRLLPHISIRSHGPRLNCAVRPFASMRCHYQSNCQSAMQQQHRAGKVHCDKRRVGWTPYTIFAALLGLLRTSAPGAGGSWIGRCRYRTPAVKLACTCLWIRPGLVGLVGWSAAFLQGANKWSSFNN